MSAADGCPERTSGEAYLSAQQSSAGSSPRLPPSHGNSCGSSNTALPAAERPPTARSVIEPLRRRSCFAALRGARAGRSGGVRARAVADLVPRDRVGVAYALNRKLGGAVTRNRIRRRLRSAMDALDKQGRVLQDGAGYLVAADIEAASCPYTVLQASVEDAIRAANARSTERTPR